MSKCLKWMAWSKYAFRGNKTRTSTKRNTFYIRYLLTFKSIYVNSMNVEGEIYFILLIINIKYIIYRYY